MGLREELQELQSSVSNFQLEDRVEIASGVLEGELATITASEDGRWQRFDEDGENENVFIRFDRQDTELGPEQGNSILRSRWEDVDQLRRISL